MEFGQWNSYILDFLKIDLARIYNNTILNVDENQKVNVLQQKILKKSLKGKPIQKSVEQKKSLLKYKRLLLFF